MIILNLYAPNIRASMYKTTISEKPQKDVSIVTMGDLKYFSQ